MKTSLSERITTDADFVNSFLISERPYKLLLVSTGHISNRELGEIFVKTYLQLLRRLHFLII